MSEPVLSMTDGRVGIIELSRPEKFNCLSLRAWELIDSARRQFEADTQIRAILIRAQGKHFCTGADLEEVKGLRSSAQSTGAFIERGHQALLAFEASPLPIVAAVQGLCLAGGIELMLGTDVVFAAQTARIGDQHAQFGLVPGWGGSQRLARLIGLRRALDIMYSARWIEADEARSIGLVNYVSADDALWDEAMAYASKLSQRSRVGLAEMKRLAREGLSLSPQQAMRLEADAAARHILGPDTAEGLAAFEERRDPKFE
jgi:enoyl-CoA hydratase/carnithine racemase